MPPPLLLLLYAVIPEVCYLLLHAAADVLTAYLLECLARRHKEERGEVEPLRVSKEGNYPLEPLDPRTIGLIYLFNPLTVAVCVSGSTAPIANAAMAAALLLGLKGDRAFSMLSLAVATYLQVYPVITIFPLCHLIWKQQPAGRGHLILSYASSLVFFLVWLASLVGLSFLFLGSFNFLRLYQALVSVQNLAPNLGLHWYLNAVVFDSFRDYFLFVLQYHMLIFPIPLLIRAPDQPLFVSVVMVFISNIFKPYPSIADIALSIPLVALYVEFFHRMRHRLVICQLLLYALGLCPVLWHLWIRLGSGNANSYFTATIMYNLGQVLLLIELVRAFFKAQSEAELKEKAD